MEIKVPAVDNLTEIAKDFIQKIITPPLEEVGNLLADQVKLWRFKNQISIITKADQYLKNKNIHTKKVSLKILAPLLEACSLEEDQSLQDKWAALLANTSTENTLVEESTLFVHILSQLSRKDADVFEVIYKYCTREYESNERKNKSDPHVKITVKLDRGLPHSHLIKILKNSDVSIDNLIRLRLLKEIDTNVLGFGTIMLTDLGFSFMSAVMF
jgi:hypothetical protein